MECRVWSRLTALLAAAAFITGCQGEAGNPVPHGSMATVLGRSHRGSGSWMRPGSSNGDLVYVASGKNVFVYSYPGGKQVGTLSGFNNALGDCADANGNVWIADAAPGSYVGGTLVEYAHGGTNPIATLEDAGDFRPVACSVDPSTGNLAAANSQRGGVEYPITVWADAQGSPTYIERTEGVAANNPFTIAYYGNGDLYIRSGRYRKGEAWVPKGSYTIMQFDVRKKAFYGWDGKYFVINSGAHSKRNQWNMTRFTLNGAEGTISGHVTLSYTSCIPEGAFSIEGSELAVICASAGGRGIAYYKYPAGEAPVELIPSVPANGVAISIAKGQ